MELIERYFAAWNAHDPDAIMACFSEEGTLVGITDCSPDSITEIPQLLSGAASLCRV